MKKYICGLSFCFNMVTVVQAQDTGSAINKGNAFYKESQFDLAEKAYRSALQKNEKNSTAQYNLALSLYKQKKYKEAEEITDKLTHGGADNTVKAAAYYNKGVIQTKEKNLEQSIDSYKAALRLTPDDKEGRENLQKALLELKKQQQEEQKRQKQPKPQSSLTQKEVAQKLKSLQDKEKNLQERLQNSKQTGSSQAKDW